MVLRERTYQETGENCVMRSSPDITWGMKAWKMRWAGHVERMGVKKNAYRV